MKLQRVELRDKLKDICHRESLYHPEFFSGKVDCLIKLAIAIEEIYPERDRFDPERFAPNQSGSKQVSFGYIPFGNALRESN